MYKNDKSENKGNSNKQLSNKSRLKQSRQINFQDNRSRQFKENDSKHFNAIKPYMTKQKKNQKRQNVANEISRSKSKKLDSSNRKAQQNSTISCCHNAPTINPTQGNKQINQIFQELVLLKAQYKSLKDSYNHLMTERQQLSIKQQSQKFVHKKQQNILTEQLQKYKKSNALLQTQVQRIKRECFKILQSQKFKYKKLQQTLQQKQLMISYLRKQIQYLKKSNVLNVSQQQNLQKYFFLQNSAPIFSYESYARLSANNSIVSDINNVLIEGQSTPNQIKDKKLYKYKKSQFQEDSLSLSRDKSKQFDSIHSLLSNNNDQTILSFTKKDIVVLDDSLSLDDSQRKSSLSGHQDFSTHQNKKNKGKQIISFENLKSQKMMHKSESRVRNKKIKHTSQHTKRLRILTDEYKYLEKQKSQGQNSCETKKKFSKSKTKNVKKNSENQGVHISMINQMLQGSFIKNDIQIKNPNSKRK